MIKINTQPIEKLAHNPSGNVEVHSIFATIQGEGPFTGQPAVFVRLAGCNLQCPGCDTEYTSSRQVMSPFDIEDVIFRERSKEGNKSALVVITGGEPFRQNIGPLINYLIGSGWRVQIETNGVLPPSLGVNITDLDSPSLTIVCSPKTAKVNNHLIYNIAAYKYVVKTGDIDPSDGLPIRALTNPVAGRVARPPAGFPRRNIYVQAMDEGDAALNALNLDAAVASSLAFGYTLCIQIHKLINVQ